MPTSANASFTSSSLNGLMMASIFFIERPPRPCGPKQQASSITAAGYGEQAHANRELNERLQLRQSGGEGVVQPQLQRGNGAAPQQADIEKPAGDAHQVHVLQLLYL